MRRRRASGPACVVSARQGRRVRGIRESGEYTMCLTASQAAKLFPAGVPPKAIDLGVSGAAAKTPLPRLDGAR